MAALNASQSAGDRFAHLPRGAIAALRLRRLSEARQLAEEALTLAPADRGGWNYGNAIHYGHTVLGLLALDQGDVPLAIGHLRSSADIPGSPQLNSFGPTMQLAKELLRRGEHDAVQGYLQQCGEFWKTGTGKLELWRAMIREGEMPDLSKHCYV